VVFTSIRDITPEEVEEIRAARKQALQTAITRSFLKLSRLRKGESITLQLEGGFGKPVHPTFKPGEASEEGGDETYYKYEFFVMEGNIEAGINPNTHVTWPAPRTYFLQLDPLLEKGHSLFKIICVHSRTENNVGTVANYKIEAVDAPDEKFAKLIGGK
jgi:hypothetical protein